MNRKAKKILPTPKGLDLIGIMDHFRTDDDARDYLEAIRWPDGPFCPHCGNADQDTIWKLSANASKKIRPGLYHCKECDKQFTVTVGTIFEDSHIPLRKWLIAWYLLCSSKKGISALQIQRQLGLGSYRTAWFMMHRIRYALRQPEFSGKLGGTVECDETWMGGKAKGFGGGRYREKKTPVVAVIQRGGPVRSQKVDRVTSANLKRILRENVDTSATLNTDDNRVYDWPHKEFAKHEVVNHTAKEYVRGQAHVNTAEGYFGLLKRGVAGTFHHVSRKYLDQYLGEFDFRWNERNVNDGERTGAALSLADGKRVRLHDLVHKEK